MHIDEVKSELAGFLFGYDVPKVRDQASQIAMAGSLFSGVAMVTALLDENPLSFLKHDWDVLFRPEVPGIFWWLLKRYVQENNEAINALVFLSELLEESQEEPRS
jgi:hypothetical protein